MKIIRKINLALVMATISSSVLAAAAPISTTGNFQTSATLSASCDVKVNLLSFGTIAPTTADVDISSTMTVRCSKGVYGSIGMTGGNSGTSSDRYMVGSAGNTEQLRYNVFGPSYGIDEYHGWGAAGSSVYEDFQADGNDQVVTITGRVYGNQYVKPDTYTDSLTVSIEY